MNPKQKNKICQSCKQEFTIEPEDFLFYEKIKVPAPTFCMKPGCTNEFETSYAPERPEIIYCEKCYQQEVY